MIFSDKFSTILIITEVKRIDVLIDLLPLQQKCKIGREVGHISFFCIVFCVYEIPVA